MASVGQTLDIPSQNGRIVMGIFCWESIFFGGGGGLCLASCSGVILSELLSLTRPRPVTCYLSCVLSVCQFYLFSLIYSLYIINLLLFVGDKITLPPRYAVLGVAYHYTQEIVAAQEI